MQDNGYDISDYEDIDPIFGTLGDLDALVEALHERGMRLVMDLVVNHTSSEHSWFRDSRTPGSPCHDWYIWRDPKPGAHPDPAAPAGTPRGDEPNPWMSAFFGPAWTWDAERGEYYLHLFAPGQPDLNWDNPNVRLEIFAMMRRWLDRGIDGFRMDVINLISNDQARATTDPSRGELDMVFQFEHMALDQENGNRFCPIPLHLPAMKRTRARWNLGLSGHGWNALYLSNHDQARPVSRYGDPVSHRHASATAWAGMLHAHQGTPFVYQGEEIGMANYPWADISELRDVETLGYWHEHVEVEGENPAAVWPGIVAGSRDNARTPMQWDGTPGAGFTTGDAWLPVNPDHLDVNVAAQVGVPGSTFEFFRRMISLRHSLRVLVDGDFDLLEPDHPVLWWVRRLWHGRTFDAVANMSSDGLLWDLPEGDVVLANCAPPVHGHRPADRLSPWEMRWIVS